MDVRGSFGVKHSAAVFFLAHIGNKENREEQARQRKNGAALEATKIISRNHAGKQSNSWAFIAD